MSIHENLARELEVKAGTDRNFGFVFAVVFAVTGIYLYFDNSGVYPIWTGVVSFLFLIIAISRPHLLAPLNKAWTKLGIVLQKIVSPIVLGAMYFLILTPFGLGLRLLGKDLLSLKLDKTAISYWVDRSLPGPSSTSMKNQF